MYTLSIVLESIVIRTLIEYLNWKRKLGMNLSNPKSTCHVLFQMSGSQSMVWDSAPLPRHFHRGLWVLNYFRNNTKMLSAFFTFVLARTYIRQGLLKTTSYNDVIITWTTNGIYACVFMFLKKFLHFKFWI